MSLGGATNIAKLGQNFEIFVNYDERFCDNDIDSLASRCKYTNVIINPRFSHYIIMVCTCMKKITIYFHWKNFNEHLRWIFLAPPKIRPWWSICFNGNLDKIYS